MLECDYIVKQIDGDYAHLQRVDQPEAELKLVEMCIRDSRALYIILMVTMIA